VSRASYPHCGAGYIVKFGSSGGTQRYRCNACLRTFTALSGTPFSRLREKGKLLANAECMAAGLLVRKTA
jgi:transposase-like protein